MGIKSSNSIKSCGVSADGLSSSVEKRAPDMQSIDISDKYDTKILLVRHGESLGNANHSFLGHTDKDLSERGYEQARRTAKLLENVHIDVFYSSDLMRAYNTGKTIAQPHGLSVEKRKELRELYIGDWEGMTVADITVKYPDLFNTWKTDFGNVRCPGGESAMELQARIYDEVLGIAKLNRGKTILLAFHAAAIRVLWARLLGLSKDQLNDSVNFPYNASVSVAYLDGDTLVPGIFSHMKHLTDI